MLANEALEQSNCQQDADHCGGEEAKNAGFIEF